MAPLGKLLKPLFFFILLSQVLLAQNSDSTTYKILWHDSKTLNIEGKSKQIYSFYKACHNSYNQYLPSFTVSIVGIHVLEASLQDDVWEEASEEQFSHIPDLGTISPTVSISIGNATEKKRPSTTLEFVPLRRNAASGKIEKLLKFKFNLVQGETPKFPIANAAQFRQMTGVNSVLSQGEWYKLGFNQTGIFKIDYSYLVSMGINPSSINPNKIQLWANSYGMLPEPCNKPKPLDLTQNPIFVFGAEDGKFDQNDYILFYVQGPDVWFRNDGESFFRPRTHVYSRFASYFLTIGTADGLRIRNRALDTSTPIDVSINTYTNLVLHELEQRNFLASGRRWYGEEFEDVTERTYNLSSTGVNITGKIYIQSSLMNKSTSTLSSSFRLFLNKNLLNTIFIGGSGTGDYAQLGLDKDVVDSLSSDSYLGSKNLEITYRYQKSSNNLGTGYLNYYALNFDENLVFKSNPTFFRKIGSNNYNAVQYDLNKSGNVSMATIWDVTNLDDIFEVELVTSANSFSFKSKTEGLVREFVAFSGNSFPYPVSQEKILNQNIRAASTPDLLIVTHPNFKAQANRLADFRRTHDKLDVLVATTEEVYNEFSSGMQDLVAIRNCAKMFYDRNFQKFKYLLLFGNASYDYKNFNNNATPTSLVPIYESEVSMHPIKSYSSDDYVGMLDDDDGNWYAFDKLDIGVGRLPVKSTQEAESVVNKLINYSSNTLSNLGDWKQKLAFIADNGDGNIFLTNAEMLSQKLSSTSPNYNINKIYIASYQKEVLPNNTVAPGANADVSKAINEGILVLNYIGHGNERQMASEAVLTSTDIQTLNNIHHPFVVTATCDFGKYDDPNLISGAEYFILQPSGGAIGLLTTTRPVYQYGNELINASFNDNVLLKVNNEHQRLGEIQRICKNNSIYDIYNRNFALLGDPSMLLSYPKDNVVLTKINNQSLNSSTDTLKAQSKVTFSGEIQDAISGLKRTDFNGVVNILVYDKDISVQTIDQPMTNYPKQQKKIFDGSATVRNGEFNFTFIVSKDINYTVGLGKISLYANVENGTLSDAGGVQKINIGSAEKNVVIDNTPPQVKVFLNDESFVQGGITGNSPLLIVKLYDENGISSVGGIGTSITATINGDSKNQIVLDSYFKSDRDSYQSGTIRFRLSNLPEGDNTIKINAFDANKIGVGKENGILNFTVLNSEKLALKHVLNYPNPFTNSTVFHFDHNRAGDNLEVMLQIFTVTGKLVKTFTSFEPNAKTHISEFHWDGKDDFGDAIGRGVYVYKLSVKALSDGVKKEAFEKLVILN
jgi:hypothetical protein